MLNGSKCYKNDSLIWPSHGQIVSNALEKLYGIKRNSFRWTSRKSRLLVSRAYRYSRSVYSVTILISKQLSNKR